MNNQTDNIQHSTKAGDRWYASVISTAVVGFVFSFIILLLLVFNFVHATMVQARREQELIDLKAAIYNRPDDPQLLSQARRLDLQFRQNLIRNLDFNRRGAYLLLGSIVITLIGFKGAGSIKKKMPRPQPQTDRLKEQMQDAGYSRYAVTAGIIVLGLGCLLLAVGPEVVFYETKQVDTSYPLAEQINRNWPRFRGPGGLGISEYTNIPVNWDGQTGQGILWKTKVPLPGMNSPVVWEDKVFFSGADPNNQQVYCFDAVTGKLLWTGNVRIPPLKEGEEPLDIWEDTGTAASTVATDGRRVYAIFATGVAGCFDFDGNKIWEKDLGRPDNMYGHASSLTMYQNLLLIQYYQAGVEDGKSRLIALESYSGRTAWQVNPLVGSSWTSPIVIKTGDDYQLITCGNPLVISFNPADGKELWRVNCLGADIAPSPVFADGLVFAIEPHMKTVAISPDGQGDVTDTNILWKIDGGPDICSPLSNGEFLFLLATEGYLGCHKTDDGARLWEQNMKDYFQASPSLVGNNLYLLSEEGVMFIVEAAGEYKELARNELGEKCFASPAFSDGHIYIRGLENLYCIGK